MDLSKSGARVLLIVASDLGSASGRAKQAVAHALAEHNSEALRNGWGVVLLVDIPCCSHVAHGIAS
eukprot:10619176-Alexandrium_andersonii.AAC.1